MPRRYIILILEGAATTKPVRGKTPLEAAQTPELDRLARRGKIGSVRILPEDVRLPPEAAFLSLLGYDPRHYTGRGAVIAAALRVTLAADDIAFCCPLIASDGTTIFSGQVEDATNDEVITLMGLVASRLGNNRLAFYPAPQNASLMTFASGPVALLTTPPRKLANQALKTCLPQGEDAERLQSVIYDSLELLADHPINQQRKDRGQLPLNTIWPYGRGGRLSLRNFTNVRGVTGAAITNDILVQGIARAVGMSIVTPPTANGPILVAAAREALKAGAEFLLIPVISKQRDVPEEMRQEEIERIDREVIEPLFSLLQKGDVSFRLLCLTTVPDDLTANVPFLLYDAEQKQTNNLPFDERAVSETRLIIEEGHRLADVLFE